MKNAVLRFGYACAPVLIASGLMATAAKAEMHDVVNVTLPDSVIVGSTTLPSGRYTITSMGSDVYLIHDDNGDHAMVLGRPVDTSEEPSKTALVLKNDGEGFHLDKLVFEGQTAGVGFNQ